MVDLRLILAAACPKTVANRLADFLRRDLRGYAAEVRANVTGARVRVSSDRRSSEMARTSKRMAAKDKTTPPSPIPYEIAYPATPSTEAWSFTVARSAVFQKSLKA